MLATSEDHEIAAWRDLAAAASGHGLAADERGRAFLMAAPGCPIPPFNQVLGIGRHGPATIDEISEATAWFADRGVYRYWLQLGTGPVPSRVERWLAAHHFVLEYRSVLLARSLRAPLAGAASDLDVRRVGADAARGVGRVAAESFGWPPAAQDLSACVVGRPGWRHYLVYEGPVPVGGGAAYEADGTVWLGFGGVLATHRRRGGQAALLARRIKTLLATATRPSSTRRRGRPRTATACARASWRSASGRSTRPRRGVASSSACSAVAGSAHAGTAGRVDHGRPALRRRSRHHGDPRSNRMTMSMRWRQTSSPIGSYRTCRGPVESRLTRYLRIRQ